MNTFLIKDAVAFGWRKMKEHFWFVVGLTFISCIPQLLKAAIDNIKNPGAIGVIASIFLSVISLVILIGTIKIYLKLYGNEPTHLGDILKSHGVFWKFLGTYILFILIVGVGTILLIIPGVIFAFRYSMALNLVVDKGLRPIEALKESSKITFGHKWHLVGLSFVLIGVNILGLLALGIGLFVTVPITTLSLIYVYKKLTGSSVSANVAEVVGVREVI